MKVKDLKLKTFSTKRELIYVRLRTLSLLEPKKNFIRCILFWKKQKGKIGGVLNLEQLLPNYEIGINKLEKNKGGKGETCVPLKHTNRLLV